MSDQQNERETKLPAGAQADARHEPVPQKSVYALQFIAILNRERFEFRCFPDQEDRKRRDKPQQFFGSLDEHKSKLRLLNNNGYGIFVQVNQSDGKGSKAANIVAAPAFFADLDGAPLENVSRLSLPPHLTVSSSDGKFHAYWRVRDIPLLDYKGTQQRLAKLFDSDPAVCDLPRVMRLPGFLHQKNPSSPYLVRPLEAGDHAAFTFAEFLSALDAAEVAHRPAAQARVSRDHPNTGLAEPGDITRDEQMLRFLVRGGVVELAAYKPWIDLGIAIKNSHGEAGFALWHAMSAEAENYEGEEGCRRAWDAIKPLEYETQRRTIATYWKQAKEAGYSAPSANKRSSDQNGSARGATAKPDQAIKVMQAADEAGDERFLDVEGTPYVRFRHQVGQPDEHWVTARIDSELYQQVLRRRFYRDALTKTLSAEQLKGAISLLAAEATEEGVQHPVYLRNGWFEGKLYIDLAQGDGQALEVDGQGYRVTRGAPIRFVRGSRGALPLPEAGGTLADLKRHMPALETPDVQRALAYAMATFNDEGTYPLLLFSGGQGTFKSTMADMIVALTDPPVGRRDARFSFTSKEQDLLIHASGARVLYFDNVSSFGPRESDMLCRLLSGAAFSTRVLYTNGEEHRIALRRPIVATSIETPTRRGDLLDRVLPVAAMQVTQRRTEEEIWAAFEADRAKLFGLVVNGISQAIRNRHEVAARVSSGALKLPRLADFAQFVEGAAEVIGLAPGEFCAMLRREQAGLQAEAAAGDPLGSALVRYFSIRGRQPLNCTAAELLSYLADGTNDRQRGWPSTNKVRGHLERIRPGLQDIGIEVQFTAPQGKRNVWSMQISITDVFSPNLPQEGAL